MHHTHHALVVQVNAKRRIAPNFIPQLKLLEAALTAQSTNSKPNSPGASALQQGQAAKADSSIVPTLDCDLPAAIAKLLDIAAETPQAVSDLALACHAQLIAAAPDPPTAIASLVSATFSQAAKNDDHSQNARQCLADVLRTAVDGSPEQLSEISQLPAGALVQALQAEFEAESSGWQDLLLDVPLAGSFARSFLDRCRPRQLSQQEEEQYSRLYSAAQPQQPAKGKQQGASADEVSCYI